jgi:hypothetical protein
MDASCSRLPHIHHTYTNTFQRNQTFESFALSVALRLSLTLALVIVLWGGRWWCIKLAATVGLLRLLWRRCGWLTSRCRSSIIVVVWSAIAIKWCGSGCGRRRLRKRGSRTVAHGTGRHEIVRIVARHWGGGCRTAHIVKVVAVQWLRWWWWLSHGKPAGSVDVQIRRW